MFKIFLLSILFSFFAHAQLYTIKLAVYKNLNTLQKNIAKLDSKYKTKVQIKKVGNLHKAFVKPQTNKAVLKKELPTYKKVFSDAFITTYSPSKTIPVKIKKSTPPIKAKKNPPPAKQPDVKVTPSTKSNKTTSKELSFYDKVQEKTLYLCSHGKIVGGQKILMRVDFGKKSVTYTPIMGKILPVKGEYRIENKKLYLYQKDKFNSKIYSTLEESTSEYYLISSWAGEKKMNTMRYYFNLADAKAYMGSLKVR